MKFSHYVIIFLCLFSIFYVICTFIRKLVEQENSQTNALNKLLSQKSIFILANETNSTHHQNNNLHHKAHQTFFTLIQDKYPHLIIDKEDRIPTDHFLNYSSDAFSIFDNFNSIAFSQVKDNVIGNIVKLRAKYSTNMEKFYDLQSIVEDEIHQGTTMVQDSSTDALMWLVRSFWFLREFLFQFSIHNTNTDFSTIVSKSYENTIRPYHNWFIQNIFDIAMLNLPKTQDFLRDLTLDPIEYSLNKTIFDHLIVEDMKKTVKIIDFYIDIMKIFYNSRNLKLF